jgi:SAM-dependent methyltransferase
MCKSKNLVSVLNLGDHYLSDFRDDLSKPDSFPLDLLLCEDCSLVQLSVTVDRNLMYHDGYGYRSGTNELIRENLKWIVKIAEKFIPAPKSWLDIACNDGTLLSFVNPAVNRVGIDPVKKFAVGSQKHADKIISDFYSSKAVSDKFDVITSISMFYDLDDPNNFVSEVSKSLNKGGVWLIQQNYLAAMLENVSFDNICHEHITYFSLTALKYLFDQNDLEIVDLEFPTINGGSILTVVAHKGDFTKHPKLDECLETEFNLGLTSKQGFNKFASDVFNNISKLGELLDEISQRNETVQIYGASTRGGTIWQSLGNHIDAVDSAVERQVEKVGKYYSVIGKPIISEEQMRVSPPNYLLIGPWFLRNSFIDRESQFISAGGAMIFPLPHVEIIRNI